MASVAAMPMVEERRVADAAREPVPANSQLRRQLRRQLGPFGYQWLCACAIYPRLRFALTTHLGAVLARELGRTPLTEEEHLALFGLAWFRQGWMPDDLRLHLVRDLEPAVRDAVRTAVASALYTVVASPPREGERGAIGLAEPPRRWLPMLRAYLASAPADAMENDIIFVRYMHAQETDEDDFQRRGRLAAFEDRSASLTIPGPLRLPLAIIFWIEVIAALVGVASFYYGLARFGLGASDHNFYAPAGPVEIYPQDYDSPPDYNLDAPVGSADGPPYPIETPPNADGSNMAMDANAN